MFPDGTTQTTAATAGGGTITGVTAGTGLTGGGTTGNVTLSINTATIPQLGATNTFTGNQNVGGTIIAVVRHPAAALTEYWASLNAASGQTYGVGGLAASPRRIRRLGGETSASGGIGVYGYTIAQERAFLQQRERPMVSTARPLRQLGSTGRRIRCRAYGVQGSGTTDGVYGTGTVNGVFGIGGFDGVVGNGTLDGVQGLGTGAGSTGVYGSGLQYGVQGLGHQEVAARSASPAPVPTACREPALPTASTVPDPMACTALDPLASTAPRCRNELRRFRHWTHWHHTEHRNNQRGCWN